MKKIVKLNKKDNNYGFTLLEILAVIVILSVVFFMAYRLYNVLFSKVDDSSLEIALNNIKESASLYAKEQPINWIKTYDQNGKVTKKYYCVTINELINNGYFKDNLLDSKLYKNYSKNTYIEISQDDNSSNTSISISDETDRLQCIYNSIRSNLFNLNYVDRYTDRIFYKFNVEDNGYLDINDVYSIYNGEKVEKGTDEKYSITNLKNDTTYQIKLCAKEKQSDSYYCEGFDILTKDFNSTKIDITDNNVWKIKKYITLKYNDKNIYDLRGNHYLKSKVDLKTTDLVYECDENNNCSNPTKTIKPDILYKINDSSIQLKTDVGSDIDSKGMVISTYIADESNNYMVNNENVKMIDVEPPTLPNKGSIGDVSGSDVDAKIKVPASGSKDKSSGFDKYLYYVQKNSDSVPTDTSKYVSSLDYKRACGTSYYAWVVAVDKVGNMSEPYYLGTTKDNPDNASTTSCSKMCGTGTKTTTNTCALKKTETSNCNKFSCSKGLMLYKFGSNYQSKCEKRKSGSHPYRRYYYNEYYCSCTYDANNGGISNHWAIDTTTSGVYNNIKYAVGHGGNNYATVYYQNNANGISACNSKVNYYVYKVCGQEIASTGTLFHGYYWFSGARPTTTAYTDFSGWNYWLHDFDGLFDTQNTRINQSGYSDVNSACKATCENLYGKTVYR